MNTDMFQQSNEPGMRYDANKLRYDLIPQQILDELAAIYSYGAGKYADDNWRQGMRWRRVYGSAMRHLAAAQHGEELDPESGLPHLSHALWNIATLMVYQKLGLGTDNWTEPGICAAMREHEQS